MSVAASVTLERNGAIATVTLARAARRNAINAQMLAELTAICRAFVEDEQTRAVIIRADGSDFSVGADLKEPPSRAEGASMVMRRRTAARGAALMRAIRETPQPTICAVQGVATGGGACIATACDFRIGAETARIGYGEVKLGMNLMWQAAPLCVHLVGPARAKQMIMTGRLFDAPTLERWGFLDQLVPAAELDAAALAMAGEYAALPPNAVQMIKRSIDALAGALDGAVMHMDADQFVLATMTDDYREAVAAFLEKRPPNFTGD